MRIYITHCSAKKKKSLKKSKMKVKPDKLYAAAYVQRFIEKCKHEKVKWAIFSDEYGVWFPNEKHKWYDKHPSKVREDEFQKLLTNFNRKLRNYSEIWFYYNPGRFHKLYKRLLDETSLRNRVHLFTHIAEIE